MAMEQIDAMEAEYVLKHHQHDLKDNQCSSFIVRHIEAPVDIVWSLVRQFDKPQEYKPFVSECLVQSTDSLKVGTLRKVNVRSGLPATTSIEMLSIFDDEKHILGVRFVGGDHRLKNYSSLITLHAENITGREGTMVIESFVVDIPSGNTKDDTCYFVKVYIKLNFTCLSIMSERLVARGGHANGHVNAAIGNGNGNVTEDEDDNGNVTEDEDDNGIVIENKNENDNGNVNGNDNGSGNGNGSGSGNAGED